MSPKDEMQFLTHALRVLNEPARLKMVGLLAMRPRYGEELAEILELSPATVSHHLRRLREGMLIRSHKEPPYIRYELRPEVLPRLCHLLERAGEWAKAFGLPSEEMLTQQALRGVLDEEGRVTRLPKSPRHATLVLRWIVLRFESGRIYPQREVRRILLDACRNEEAVLQELVARGWLQQKGGVLRRTEEVPA